MKGLPIRAPNSDYRILRRLICACVLIAAFLWSGLLNGQIPSIQSGGWHTEPIRYSAEFLSRQYTIENGLPLNSVNGIVQDSSGYLYLATWEGLVRYDGYHMRVYQTLQYPELGSNRIANVTLGQDNILWLRQGANMLTTFQDNRFALQTTRLHPDDSTTTADFGTIRHKVFDQSGSIWVGSNSGLHVKHRNQPHFERMQHPLLQGDIRYIQMISPGDFAAITPHGLVISQMNELYVLHPADNMGIPPHGVYGFRLYLNTGTTTNSGVPADLDIPTDSLTSENHGNDYALLLYGTHGIAYYQNQRKVHELTRLDYQFMYDSFQESPNTILIGGREGYFRLHTDSLFIETFDSITNSERSFRPELILRLKDGRLALIGDQGVLIEDELIGGFYDLFSGYADHENSLWLGSHLQGLYQIRSSPIENMIGTGETPLRNVYSVIESSDGALWAASAHSGLYRFENGEARRWNTGNGSIRLNITRFLHEDTDSTLYAGFWGGGLVSFNGEQWVEVQEVSELHKTIEFTVSSMFRDATGRLLIGTDRHLVEKTGDKFSLVVPGKRRDARMDEAVEPPPSNQRYLTLPAHPAYPLEGNFQVIREHPSGSVLAGTASMGLLWLTADNDTMTIRMPDGLSSNNLRDIFVQSADTLWIANEDRGLSRIVIGQFCSGTQTDESGLQSSIDQVSSVPYGKLPKRSSLAITNITTMDGLHHNSLHRIIKDAYGTLWISSNGGIMSVPLHELNRYADGLTDHLIVTLHDEHSGMANREANGGVQHSGTLTSDGRILFANQSGLTIIHPERFQQTQAHLTGIMPEVFIENVRSDERTIYVTRSNALTLDRSERNLRLAFTAPNFANPERLSFRYRLHGTDTRWQQTERPVEAVYTNLSPGTYRFEVQAIGMNGEQRSSMLLITIPPYFHETWIFYLLILLATAGLLSLLVLWRLRNLHRWKRIQELIDTQTREIKRAAEERGRFFSGITHELKTPLSLILGPVEELLEGSKSGYNRLENSKRVKSNDSPGPVFSDATLQGGHTQGDGVDSHAQKNLVQLSTIQRNAMRMLDLVRQMLEISRISSDSLKLRCKPVDLYAVTRDIASQLAELTEKKKVQLHWHKLDEQTLDDTEADNTALYVDHGAWERIVMNLLTNAIKHSPEGGHIMLGLRSTGRHREVAFFVRDQGKGIPEPERARLFDYFYQGSSSSRSDGSGIGLYLVKLLVERMGGTVYLSENITHGAEFVVTLRRGHDHLNPEDLDVPDDLNAQTIPHAQGLQAADFSSSTYAPSHLQTHSHAVSPDTIRSKVLIVEDSEEYRCFLATQLSQFYAVKWTSGGEAALEILEHWPADLILTDVVMPGMSGLEFTARLRMHDRLNHLPVVMLSGQDEQVNIQQGLSSGADVYLSKPVRRDTLISQIDALIRRERLLSETKIPRHERHTPDSLTAQVHALVYRHMGNPALKPEVLAEALFMSRSALYREWGKENTTTLKRFIRKVRLDEAAVLLHDKKYSVQQAALATGFTDASYFSTAFKKAFGVSPSEWAARSR